MEITTVVYPIKTERHLRNLANTVEGLGVQELKDFTWLFLVEDVRLLPKVLLLTHRLKTKIATGTLKDNLYRVKTPYMVVWNGDIKVGTYGAFSALYLSAVQKPHAGMIKGYSEAEAYKVYDNVYQKTNAQSPSDDLLAPLDDCEDYAFITLTKLYKQYAQNNTKGYCLWLRRLGYSNYLDRRVSYINENYNA